MAVGPLRAILVAHGQASLNRAVRELGRGGAAAGLVLWTLARLSLLVPFGGLGLLFGFLFGRELSPVHLGVLLTAVSLGAGVASALFGGKRQLWFEAHGTLPVPAFKVLCAELLASLLDAWTLSCAVALGGLCAGVFLRHPGLFVWVALSACGLGLTLLATPVLLLCVGGGLVRRLRSAGLWLAVVALASGLVLPRLLLSAGTGSASQKVNLERLQQLKEVMGEVGAAARWLPGTAAARSLQRASVGDFAGAARAQAYPLGLGLGVAALALVALQREARPRAGAGNPGSARLWSVRSAPQAIARLQWHAMLASTPGKFALFLPLVALALAYGPLGGLGDGDRWLLPVVLAYATLGGATFHYNQFGLDGHGVKVLLLLPIPPADLLLGKAVAVWCFQGLGALALLVAFGFLRHLHPSQLGAGACYVACLCLTQNSVGQWTSTWMPRAIRPGALNNRPLPPLVAWLSFGVMVAVGGVLGVIWAALPPAWRLPVLALLAVGAGVANARLRREAAAYLERRREALMDALG